MEILKLILLCFFMYFSSKSFSIFLKDKLKINENASLAVGYFANIALFFVLEFPVMLFKLSSSFLFAIGIVYLIICLIFMILANKKLFYFNKKELISLLFAFFFLGVFAYFIDFGYIETYDNYFYSVLSNSSITSQNVSMFNPYTGLANIDNFYKYISFYHQAGFLGKIFCLKNPATALIWVFSFMNLFTLAYSAFGCARISKDKMVNNILSAFVLSFSLSIIRSPLNALHILTLVMPLYFISLGIDILKEKNIKKIILYIILSLTSIAISSTTLFVLLPLAYILFIANCFTKKIDNKYVYLIAIPAIFLAFLYLYESLNNILVILLGSFILLVIYILLSFDKRNIIFSVIGKILFLIIPIVLTAFLMVVSDEQFKNFSKLFLTKNYIEEINTKENTCLINELYEIDMNNVDLFDGNKHSSSMNYIYEVEDSNLSKILIYLTHSILKYGGMLFLLIYGLLKLKNDPLFLTYIVYLVTFFNPLCQDTLRLFSLNLNDRILLFFNAFYAIYGIKYFFEYVDSIFTKGLVKKIWEILKKIGGYIYIPLAVCSLIIFVMQFKKPDWTKYDVINKVPTTFVDASEKLDEYTTNVNYIPNIFYTSSTFNISMIDLYPNKNHRVINSKEYMNYYSNMNFINEKILINLYFESNGLFDREYLINNFEINISEDCNIIKLLKNYDVDIVVTNNTNNNEFKNYLENNFNVLYENFDILILEVI